MTDNFINNKSLRDISKEMFNLLQQYYQTDDLERILNKLLNYYYVDEIYKIQRGRFIRWISRKSLNLTNGALVMEIKFLDNGIHILCKNNIGKIIQIKFDDCIIFQKMSFDENLILTANGLLQ
jgi:hypothetical protein